MIKFIAQAVIVAVIGGCSAHLALLALDKQADNQEKFIDEYNARIAEEINNEYRY